MATQTSPVILSPAPQAAADLRTHQYKWVKYDGNGKVVLCSSAGEIPLGILMNAPNTNEIAAVAIGGIAKLIMSAACSRLAKLSSTAAGLGLTATTGHNVAATALEAAGGANQIISVSVDRNGIV